MPNRDASLPLSLLFLAAACSSAPNVPPGPPEPPEPGSAHGIEQVDALVEQRRYRAALDELDALLAAAPSDGEQAVELLDRKVRVLRLLGLERQALAAVLELRKRMPDEERFAYEAGELAAHAGDVKLAREQFAAARALAPGDWRPAVGEAALLLRAKPPQPDAADELLQPWLDGPAASADARYHHALVVETRGDPAAARAAFERVLELDARHLPALCSAARLAEAAGEREQALAFLRRARAVAVLDDEALTRELDARIAKLAS